MMVDDVAEWERIELVLEPMHPDTVDSIREEFEEVVIEALREAGEEELIDSGQVRVDLADTFPADLVVTVLVTLGVTVAQRIFEDVIWPEILGRYRATVKDRRKLRDKK